MVDIYGVVGENFQKNNEGNIFHFYGVTESERAQLQEKFQIDAHTLQSCFDPDEVARFEQANNNINIIWKIPTSIDATQVASLNVNSIGLFVRGENLIIVASENFIRFGERIVVRNADALDLLFHFANTTIKHFIEHLKFIKLASRSIQQQINISMGNKYLLQMFNLSELLIFYLDAISGNKRVIDKMLVYMKVRDHIKHFDFYNDVWVEHEQAAKQAEIYSQIFAGLMDSRSSMVSNNMNELIKNLTMINIIFMPLNLIAGIFGMSEYTRLTEHIPIELSYALFFVGIVAVGWLTFRIVRRLGVGPK